MDDNLSIAAGQDPDLYDQLAGDFAHAQRAMVDEGLDHNPDDAAEAMQLGGLTNTPPEAILADQDNFKDTQRRATAQAIVLNNPELVSYLQSHPMAASVSNDDWANLDKFTRESAGGFFQALMPRPQTVETIKKVLAGAEEGAVGGFQGADLFDNDSAIARAEDPTENRFGRLGAATSVALYSGANLIYKALAAAQGGAVGAAGAFGEAVGGPLYGQEAERFAQYTMGRGDILAPENAGLETRAATAAGVKGLPEAAVFKPPTAIEAAKPYFEAGQEPPAGLHLDIDAAKAQVNQAYVEKLVQDLDNAATSTTRERSGELFQKLTERMYGDSAIGINADAVLGMYGDKTPEIGDGILGWVPNIGQQLEEARETGADINIPLKDWMAKVDPAVSKGLEQDIRIWPGGITAREVGELPTEAKGIVDGALPIERAAAGLEPKFSMGDRKLTLGLAGKEVDESINAERHSYDILDENQQPVGQMQLTPARDRTLLVNWIGGQAGLWSNSFGPALVRDLKRQLKTLYPEYDYLTGVRVTGARVGQASTDALTSAMQIPKVWLEAEPGLDDYQKTLGVFQNGWEQAGGLEVNRQGLGFYTHEQLALGQATADEIKRLTGGKAMPQGVAGIRGLNAGRGQTVRGAYAPQYDRAPDIFYDLLGDDVRGIGRHESVHALKDYGLLSDSEWGELSKAAVTEDWLGRYGIHERYPNLSDPDKIEESIAEGFREWAGRPENERATTGVGAIFQKIWDFLDRIRQGMGKYLGREPAWEDIFRRINSGEVGGREARVPAHPEQFRFSTEDERQANIEGLSNLQAASIGMDLATFRKIQDAIRKRAEEDLKTATAQAEKEQAKRQGEEWKANRAVMATEVAKEIQQRPDIAADRFIGNGELYGQKVRQRYTLAEDRLTPEQKASLPDHYVSANGLDPDHVAGLFGYSSGDEMVGALGNIERMKMSADGTRMRGSEFVRKLVQAETDRRMEQRYGNLPENVLDAARDQALSDSSVNVMHEELMAVAQASEVTVFDKDVMQAAAKKLIDETTLGKVNSFRLMQTVGMHSRNAEKALIAGQPAEAAVHMQRQTLTAMVAKEAKAVEGEMARFEKVAKRMSAREVQSLPEEYTNWVHDILGRIGMKVRRSPEDLQRAIAAQDSGDTLQKFVEHKNHWLQPVAVWDQMYDPRWQKGYKDLQVAEFRNVRDSVKSLMTVGRSELKIYRQGAAEDFDAIKRQLIDAVKQFPTHLEKGGGEGPIGGNKISHTLRTYLASSLQMENIMGRWDSFDPNGVWTQYVMRDLIDGVNQSDAWKKEFAKKLGALKDDADLSKAVENPIFRAPPEYGGHLVPMDRGKLRAVLLNLGSKDNLRKLTKGWGVDPVSVMSWAKSHADSSDWKFAQGVWDIFDEMKERSDVMYRSMSGVPAATREAQAIVTDYGTFRGGYYPVMYHESFSKILKLQEIGLQQDGWESAATPAGYTKSLTDFYAPLTMRIDRMPNRLSQIIHDTALRPAVLNAAKVFRDRQIQAAITTHYGREYTDMLIPWLRNIANAANSSVQSPFSGIFEYLRQNMITALVGLNPGTVLKHAPTAVGLSINEVGTQRFFNAVRSMFSQSEASADSNWKFAIDNSLELQRRDRNWQENLYGATGELVAGSKFGAWRQKIMQLSSKPVALSDMISAVPTWLAQYGKGIEEGSSHGDAVFMADRAVRRAHGSTASTNRPMIMSTTNPWFTSVYNFFNDIMNRQMETVWKAGEMLKANRERDKDKAMSMLKPVVGGMLAYAIWPALVEHWVSPQQSDPRDTWAEKAGKGMAYTLGASWVGVRDIVNGLLSGKDPDVGLLSTAGRNAFDAFRDLGKKHPLNPAHAQKLIRDTGELAGLLTGIPDQVSKEASFGYGLREGTEHPHGPWGWLVGARYGTIRGHSQTFQQYMQGQYDRRRQ